MCVPSGIRDLHVSGGRWRRFFCGRLVGAFELRYALTPAAGLMIGAQRTQRASTLDIRSYHDTPISIGGQYHF